MEYKKQNAGTDMNRQDMTIIITENVFSGTADKLKNQNK